MWQAASRRKRLAVSGIDGDRLFQKRLRHQIVLPRHAPVMRQRPHDEAPRIHVVGRLAPGPEILGGVELRLDRRDDGLGDFVLHGEHVGEIAVVALRPEVTAGGHVDELGGDADVVAVLAHAAFDDVADAELLADLLVVDGFLLVDERGIPRDHIEPAQLRQRGDDVLADAFGKIFLLLLAGQVGKRQHRDRGAIERRQRRMQRLAGEIERLERGSVRSTTVAPFGCTSPTKRKPFRAMVRIMI